MQEDKLKRGRDASLREWLMTSQKTGIKGEAEFLNPKSMKSSFLNFILREKKMSSKIKFWRKNDSDDNSV